MDNQLDQALESKWAELERVTGELNALQMQAGAMDVKDYTLLDHEGNPHKLSELFGEYDQMVLIHNMGFACKYCTLWADGFNGIWRHVESGNYGTRAKFLLVSNDPPKQQRAGALQRGWEFTMVSAQGTSMFADMGFVGEKPDDWQPGVSTLKLHPGGRITRHARADFGPGDMYCSLWHLFALLPSAARDAAGSS